MQIPKNMKQLTVQTIQQFNKQNSDRLSQSKYDMSVIFNVVNKGQKSYFNLSKTINFDNVTYAPQNYQVYYAKSNDTWTNLSFKFFRTMKLWWLICKFNNIENPLVLPKMGQRIYIPTKKFVNSLMQQL